MGLFERLFGEKKEVHSSEIIEAGACPNCWGEGEYDGAFRDFVNDPTKSNIVGDKSYKKAFIAQFVEDQVSGIKLKNELGKTTCAKCNKVFN